MITKKEIKEAHIKSFKRLMKDFRPEIMKSYMEWASGNYSDTQFCLDVASRLENLLTDSRLIQRSSERIRDH